MYNVLKFMRKLLVATTIILSLVAFYLFNRTQEFDRQKLSNQTVPTVTPTKSPTPTSAPTTTQPLKKTDTASQVQPTPAKLPVLNGGNIFNLVNTYRSSNGKPFLTVSDELCNLAEIRADYMMRNGMEAFKSSQTGGHTGLIDVSSQYSGGGVGENLAANLGSDPAVIEIWKNSPPHRELMLWTEKDGTLITKGCIATRVSEVGSIVVLLVGDK